MTASNSPNPSEHIRGKLAEQLQTLKLLKRELDRHHQNAHEDTRAGAVVVAIGHLQKAMDALASGARTKATVEW